jgi:hypothetical protein
MHIQDLHVQKAYVMLNLRGMGKKEMLERKIKNKKDIILVQTQFKNKKNNKNKRENSNQHVVCHNDSSLLLL